jgi:hypothetical protein
MKRKEIKWMSLFAMVLALLARNFNVNGQTQNVPEIVIIPDPVEQSLIRFQRTAPAVVVLGATSAVVVLGSTQANGTLTNPLAGVPTNVVLPVPNQAVPPLVNPSAPPLTNAIPPVSNSLIVPPTNLVAPLTNVIAPLVPGTFSFPPATGSLLQRGRQPILVPSPPSFLPPLSSPTSAVPLLTPLRPRATASPPTRLP